MAYIGNQPASAFASTEKQTITGNGTAGPYALTHEVAAATDIACFVNNVRQEPGVAYTVSGNQMTMTGNVASTDDFYVVYIGRVVGTVNHPANAPLSATTGTFSGAVGMQGLTATTSDFSGTVNVGSTLTLDGNDFANNITMANGGTGGTTFKMFNTSDAYAQPSAHWMLHHANASNGIILADQYGRVTMPYQPMFSVTRPTTGTSLNGDIFSGQTPTQDFTMQGFTFNSANGRFTCPVAGKYWVGFHTLHWNVGCNVHIRVNGTMKVQAYSQGGVERWRKTSAFAIFHLSANDYLNFTQQDTAGSHNLHGTSHMRAVAYLIG